jgi:hypothetical protein
MEKRGVSAIVYDDAGDFYFLILQRQSKWQGWEFPKTSLQHDQELTDEQEEAMLDHLLRDRVGITQYKVKEKLVEQRQFVEGERPFYYTVFVVEASMNQPVILNSEKHKTYLWTKKDTVAEKLTWDSEQRVFEKCYNHLLSKQTM